MAEIASMRQRQKNAKEYIAAMEERIQKTEIKQQQILVFLSKAMDNPNYIQKISQKSAHRRELLGVETGGKRILAAAITWAESLQGEASSMAAGGEKERQKISYVDLAKEKEYPSPKASSGNLESAPADTWDELWSDYLLGDQSEDNIQVESLGSDWTEELDSIEDQLNF